jgi:hypothetical protein
VDVLKFFCEQYLGRAEVRHLQKPRSMLRHYKVKIKGDRLERRPLRNATTTASSTATATRRLVAALKMLMRGGFLFGEVGEGFALVG